MCLCVTSILPSRRGTRKRFYCHIPLPVRHPPFRNLSTFSGYWAFVHWELINSHNINQISSTSLMHLFVHVRLCSSSWKAGFRQLYQALISAVQTCVVPHSTYSIMGPLSRPLYKKVKSFPQPAKKQNSSHNPALFRPWISSHKHKKGILDTPVLLCSGMPESLYFKHFSAFHYVFFVIKTTVSTWLVPGNISTAVASCSV